MRKRLVIGSVGVLLLLAVGAAAALFYGNRREVTTSSDAAYRAYREGLENERRFYFRESREGFAKALQLDPQFAEAMLGLARMTDGDQGLALIRRAAKERDRLTEHERMHVDLQLAAREGRDDEPVRIARAIHEKYPDDIRAASMLARDEITHGRTERAVQIFTDLLAVEPNNAEAYNQVGYFYAYRGEYDKALENLRKYQFMAPDQANPYDSLGEIQAYSGHYDEAIQNLQQALRLKPDFWAALQHLGVAYEGKGDFARSVEFYRRAAQAAVNDGMRREMLQLARRTALFGRDRAAVEQVSGQIDSLPKQPYSEVDRLAGQALKAYLDGQAPEAEKLLREIRTMLEGVMAREKSKKDGPSGGKFYDAAWNFLMARILESQGRHAEAIALCQEMVEPPNAISDFESRRWVYEGRALLAELVARQGDLDRAEKLLAENHKWNPSWAPTRASEQVVAQLRREKVLAASK